MTLANPNEQSLSNGVGESESASVESEQVKWALDFGRFPEKREYEKPEYYICLCLFVYLYKNFQHHREEETFKQKIQHKIFYL